MNALFPIVGSAGSMLFLDAIYLTLRQSYHDNLFSSIQKSPLKIRYLAAVVVYALLTIAVYHFAVKNAKSIDDAVLRGAIVGFLMYAFYDFTNYATLTKYTFEMVVVDSLWGTMLAAAGAAAGYFVMHLK